MDSMVNICLVLQETAQLFSKVSRKYQETSGTPDTYLPPPPPAICTAPHFAFPLGMSESSGCSMSASALDDVSVLVLVILTSVMLEFCLLFPLSLVPLRCALHLLPVPEAEI